MNIDHILRTFNACAVEYLLIGGMNFLLRHEPVLTYDIDFWIRDTVVNRGHCFEKTAARGSSPPRATASISAISWMAYSSAD